MESAFVECPSQLIYLRKNWKYTVGKSQKQLNVRVNNLFTPTPWAANHSSLFSKILQPKLNKINVGFNKKKSQSMIYQLPHSCLQMILSQSQDTQGQNKTYHWILNRVKNLLSFLGWTPIPFMWISKMLFMHSDLIITSTPLSRIYFSNMCGSPITQKTGGAILGDFETGWDWVPTE